MRSSPKPSDSPIDAVYLWVDGADPVHRQQRDRFVMQAPAAQDSRSFRFRNNDELRYSLRSLQQHAPWIRTVHLVTDGQVPAWLVPGHSGIRLVHHRDIFPDASVLPCFNSCAIEWCLHRIPHLADRFLYLNDDVFFGRDCTLHDFVNAAGRPLFGFEPIAIRPWLATSHPTDRAYVHTVERLSERWTPRITRCTRAAYDRPGLMQRLRRRGRVYRRLPAHRPQFYERARLAELETLFAEHVAQTRAHRFRSGTDFVLRIAYAYYLIEAAGLPALPLTRYLDWMGPDHALAMMTDDPGRCREQLEALERWRPRTFCINDDRNGAGLAAADFPARPLLEAFFPRPSSFEKPPGG